MTAYLLAIELCLACIAIAAAYTVPDFARQHLPGVEHLLAPLVKRPRLAVIVIGLSALAARAAVLPVLPIPEPTIHDEFSYLLAADTFAHGRLTNPTHPMWMHFETFHVNQNPTYASMYYPVQGLLLAFGQTVFGHPFFGVWLSVGFMCAAICWMLQGWVPRKWALLGGFLAVIRLGIFSYWANSYYGGTMAAIGGALVLGALPRIRRRRRVRDAVLMAAGFAIVANTRPFEGLFFGVAVAVALFAWMFGSKRPPARIVTRRVLIPAGLLFALAISGTGYYFWRVTGSPFRIPYQVNMETHGLLYFPWQQLPPQPAYHHAVMRDFYLGPHNYGQYEFARSHPFEKFLLMLLLLWLFFLGPLLTLPLCCIPVLPPMSGKRISRKTRFFLLVLMVSAAGLILPIYVPFPHFAAPLTGMIYALVMQGMRHAFVWGKWGRWGRKGRASGQTIVLAVPVIGFVLLAARLAIPAFGHQVNPASPQFEFISTWGSPRWINTARAGALERLKQHPGQHLVIVRYKPGHDIMFNEWVYNEADIDNAKVVWAREMSPAENQKLIRYFHDRKTWLAEPDEDPPRLSPLTDTEMVH